jgi:hypothetical protein
MAASGRPGASLARFRPAAACLGGGTLIAVAPVTTEDLKMNSSGNIWISVGFVGAALVFAATVFVAIRYAPDQYARWGGGAQGSLVAIK